MKDLDKNLQDVKQKYQISGIIAGIDAQVGVKPRQGPFVGDGTRMSRGSTTRYYEMENKFEGLLMEWITKHEIKLANTFCKNWEPTRARMNKLDFWKQSEQQLQKWKIIDYIACTHQVGNKKHCGKKLHCSEPYRSLASDDLCKAAGKEERLTL